MSVNQGVRQGYTISPTYFNVYIDDLARKYKRLVDPGIKYFRIQNLIKRKSVFKPRQICKQYNMKISTTKPKVMGFGGKEPIRTK